MDNPVQYAVLGSGRWASVMHGILTRRFGATLVERTRRAPAETEREYRRRMAGAMETTGARAAWICVPPSLNTLSLINAALDNRMHVVIEKPWVWPRSVGEKFMEQFDACRLRLGVHYEFCLLNAVQQWRSRFKDADRLEFHGRFTTSAPNRLGIPPLLNLGSHLVAIKEYAVPEATIGSLHCDYDQPSRRVVSLSRDRGAIDEIDFSANREPIIQRYIDRFENPAPSEAFPFTLGFAARVWETLDAFRRGDESP